MSAAAGPSTSTFTANQLSDIIECPICYQVYSKPLQMSCGHTICSTCIDRLVEGARGQANAAVGVVLQPINGGGGLGGQQNQNAGAGAAAALMANVVANVLGGGPPGPGGRMEMMGPDFINLVEGFNNQGLGGIANDPMFQMGVGGPIRLGPQPAQRMMPMGPGMGPRNPYRQNRRGANGERGTEIKCPECRKTTLVPPEGLPVNYRVQDIVAKMAANATKSEPLLLPKCRVCESALSEGIYFDCIQCGEDGTKLCSTCAIRSHNGHEILEKRAITDADVKAMKDKISAHAGVAYQAIDQLQPKLTECSTIINEKVFKMLHDSISYFEQLATSFDNRIDTSSTIDELQVEIDKAAKLREIYEEAVKMVGDSLVLKLNDIVYEYMAPLRNMMVELGLPPRDEEQPDAARENGEGLQEAEEPNQQDEGQFIQEGIAQEEPAQPMDIDNGPIPIIEEVEGAVNDDQQAPPENDEGAEPVLPRAVGNVENAVHFMMMRDRNRNRRAHAAAEARAQMQNMQYQMPGNIGNMHPPQFAPPAPPPQFQNQNVPHGAMQMQGNGGMMQQYPMPMNGGNMPQPYMQHPWVDQRNGMGYAGGPRMMHRMPPPQQRYNPHVMQQPPMQQQPMQQPPMQQPPMQQQNQQGPPPPPQPQQQQQPPPPPPPPQQPQAQQQAQNAPPAVIQARGPQMDGGQQPHVQQQVQQQQQQQQQAADRPRAIPMAAYNANLYQNMPGGEIVVEMRMRPLAQQHNQQQQQQQQGGQGNGGGGGGAGGQVQAAHNQLIHAHLAHAQQAYHHLYQQYQNVRRNPMPNAVQNRVNPQQLNMGMRIMEEAQRVVRRQMENAGEIQQQQLPPPLNANAILNQARQAQLALIPLPQQAQLAVEQPRQGQPALQQQGQGQGQAQPQQQPQQQPAPPAEQVRPNALVRNEDEGRMRGVAALVHQLHRRELNRIGQLPQRNNPPHVMIIENLPFQVEAGANRADIDLNAANFMNVIGDVIEAQENVANEGVLMNAAADDVQVAIQNEQDGRILEPVDVFPEGAEEVNGEAAAAVAAEVGQQNDEPAQEDQAQELPEETFRTPRGSPVNEEAEVAPRIQTRMATRNSAGLAQASPAKNDNLEKAKKMLEGISITQIKKEIMDEDEASTSTAASSSSSHPRTRSDSQNAGVVAKRPRRVVHEDSYGEEDNKDPSEVVTEESSDHQVVKKARLRQNSTKPRQNSSVPTRRGARANSPGNNPSSSGASTSAGTSSSSSNNAPRTRAKTQIRDASP